MLCCEKYNKNKLQYVLTIKSKKVEGYTTIQMFFNYSTIRYIFFAYQ